MMLRRHLGALGIELTDEEAAKLTTAVSVMVVDWHSTFIVQVWHAAKKSAADSVLRQRAVYRGTA